MTDLAQARARLLRVERLIERCDEELARPGCRGGESAIRTIQVWRASFVRERRVLIRAIERLRNRAS